MIKQNMHIHSKYSWDCEKYGKMEIEKIAKILYKNGIRYGALTDHIEFDREPLDWVLTKLKIRNLEIDRANEIYQGKVTLLKAVEISEPHLYKNKVEQLSELDLDFIMGSIHNIEKNAKGYMQRRKAFRLYYKEVLKMIEAGQIDVVGHLDYINRYYSKDKIDPWTILEILEAIREHGQIIEINTSGSRRNTWGTFPSLEKICDYKLKGNDEIIIGSDAHQYSELLDNLDQAEVTADLLKLKPVIYQKRKRINL